MFLKECKSDVDPNWLVKQGLGLPLLALCHCFPQPADFATAESGCGCYDDDGGGGADEDGGQRLAVEIVFSSSPALVAGTQGQRSYDISA